MSKKQLITATMIAASVTLIVDLLINIAASFIQPLFEGRAGLLYFLLFLTFSISLGLAIYLLRKPNDAVSGSDVKQQVKSKGKIVESPIQIADSSQTRIRQKVSGGGEIKGSGITVGGGQTKNDPE